MGEIVLKSRVAVLLAGLIACVLAVALVVIAGSGSEPHFATIDPAKLPAKPDPSTLASAAESAAKPSDGPVNPDTADSGPKYVPHQIIVRYEASATKAQRAAARRAVGGKKGMSLPLGAEVLKLPKGVKVAQAKRTLDDEPAVKYAQPDMITHSTVTPNDEYFNSLWGLNNTGQGGGVPGLDIDATTAWDTTTGSDEVIVAVIDSGIDYNHPDLEANMWENDGEMDLDENEQDKRFNGVDDDENGKVDDWRGWDYSQGDNDPMDANAHGTHVAGTIGAAGNNGIGITGVGWNTKLMNLRTSNSQGIGSMSDAVAAMGYAAENGARVVNGSFGYETSGDYSWESDLIAAYPQTLFVFAAGNSKLNNDSAIRGYPCSHEAENIVCVAASDQSDNKASFSNYGKTTVDLAAPGVSILSTKASVLTSTPGDYVYFQGTSMAAPHVAGAAGVMLAASPTASTADLKDALLSGVDAASAFSGKVVTGGRLNLKSSMDALDFALNAQGTIARVSGTGELIYRASTGESNDLTITQDAGHINLTDPGKVISVGSGCYSVSSDQVRCKLAAIKRVSISVSDGNDEVQSAASIPHTVELGDGDDTVVTGAGDDVLNGGTGSDTISGGEGADIVDYSGRNEDLSITFDGDDNDGAAGEEDDIDTSVEGAKGGNGADTMTAGTESVTLEGGPGDDVITGSDQNDVLNDGTGADELIGGAGDDKLFANIYDGDDVLSAGSGTDVVDYSQSIYPHGNMPDLSIDGNPNDGVAEEEDNIGLDVENLIGTKYADALNGSDDANVLSGGPGYDAINGHGGDDDLQGGDGADTLDGGSGEDVMSGGDAVDTVNYTVSTVNLDISLDDVANDGDPSEPDFVKNDIENARGGSGDDLIVGNGLYNRLEGGFGNDTLHGGESGDTLEGGPGADEIWGDEGIDTMSYTSRSADVNVSLDDDDDDGEAGEEDNVHDDIEWIDAGYGNDTLTGSDEDNRLNGLGGDDEIFGGDGDDTMLGEAGADTFHGQAGSDRVTYETYTAGVSASIDGDDNDGLPGEGDLIGTDVEGVWGSTHDDTITGDANANVLTGSFGSDTIHGGDGDDVVNGFGWEGDHDQLFGEAGDDEVIGGNMYDFQSPPWRYGQPFPGTSDVHGGPGNDKVYGSIGSSAVFGDDGDDTLQGWFATDQIFGGDGIDSINYHYSFGPVNVSLDGEFNDGHAGENDQLAGDIENVTGSWGNDTITGNSDANELSGSRGNDTITGLGGDDRLTGDWGADTLDAGDGNDFLASTDDYADVDTCGDGTDTVKSDSNDTVAGDCEQSGNAARVELKREYSDADVIEYRALSGYANNVTVARNGTGYTLTDSAGPIEAGRGCSQIDPNSVECGDLKHNVYRIDVQTGDGNDTIDVNASVLIYTELDGGSGDDVLLGGGGSDFLFGGYGGNDDLHGRGGWDLGDFRKLSSPLSLSANDIADDGANGETDNIHSDIEEVAGGFGNDTLYGSDSGVMLYGYYGNDTFISGSGNDMFYGSYDTDTVSYENRNVPIKISQSNVLPTYYLFASDREKFRSGQAGEYDGIATDVERIVGGTVADTADCHLSGDVAIDGGLGADEIVGCKTVDYGTRSAPVNVSFDGMADDGETGENDVLGAGVINAIGGSGNDTFTSVAAENSFTGGSGDDQFAISDASADSANCGDGTDAVVSDGQDTIDENCESVTGAASVYRDGQRLIYSTSGNVANSVTITGDNNVVTISDGTSPIDSGYGCDSLNTNAVVCASTGITSISVSTSAGDDSVDNDTGIAMTAQTGNGNDAMSGGTGADTFIGGSGTDSVSYEGRISAIAASADGQANDGALGEGDSISTTVENLTGGAGGDTILGNSSINVLSGGDGDDTITATDSVGDTVNCGSGSDTAQIDGGDVTDGQCETLVYYSAWVQDGTLYYSAQPGEINDAEVAPSGDDYLVTDSAGLINPGSGCLPVTATELLCDGSGISAVSLDGRDGDDKLQASVDVEVPVTFTGGSGVDTVSYADQTEPLSLDLDGSANDGASGDYDSINPDVENLIGGSGNDYHYGTPSNNTFFASPGADTYLPRNGVDTVSYADRTEDVEVALDGAASDGAAGENDFVTLEVERVTGGSGDDTLTADGAYYASNIDNIFLGGAGNDTLNPGVGLDTVDGGVDDDHITTIDGQADSITCGDGYDEVVPDVGDSYGADCEELYAPSYVTYSPDPQYGSITLDTGYWNLNNNFTVTSSGGEIIIHDTVQAVIADTGMGCSQVDSKTASCPDVDVATIVIYDSYGNDTYAADSSITRPITFESQYGDDSFTGGNAADRLYATNGDGADTFYGGNGSDTADYSYKYQSVNVSLDGVPNNDGVSGENDTIAADVENVVGGFVDDIITGSDGNNSLNGYNGNDVIDGKLGADSMLGGSGTDTVTYADRSANLTITQENTGNDGDATIPENDNVRTDVEIIEGGSGDDTITAGTIANTVRGNDGVDVLNGGTGADSVFGGAGNDTLIPGDTDASSSNDTLDGGADVDTANYSARITTALKISLDDVANDGRLVGTETDNVKSNIEDIIGGGAGDTIKGSDAPNTLSGGNGNDSIDGKLEADIINGGAGTDSADYSPRTERVEVRLDGNDNDGELGENDAVASDIENLSGGGGDDFLVGNEFNNSLFGNGGNDTLMGGPSDTAGADGNDTFNGNSGLDYVSYGARTDDLNLSITGAADGASGESDNISSSIEGVQAGYGNDTLTGDAYPNSLDGSAGDDVIDAGVGDDYVTGGPGVDTISAGDGNDNVSGGSENDAINGDYGEDNLFGDEGNDDILGGDGNDSIFGGNDNDTIDGQLGDDHNFGELGDDTIESRDGQYDENFCDDGTDTLRADIIDYRDGCESVNDHPDTTIDSPANGTIFNTSTPVFTFSSNESPVTFDCLIDGITAWSCVSGDPVAALDDGEHTLQVLAIDQWGNADQTPPLIEFTTDTQGPTVSITAPTGVVASTVTPAIEFTADDASGITATTCAIDGDTPISCTNGMTWPTALAQGPHTLVVSATDGVGNVGSDSSQFIVDTTPPVTAIDSGPADGSFINDVTPEYTFSADQPNVTYECSIDGGAFTSCASPYTLPAQSEAAHTFAVRARSQYGNADLTPESRTFTVDVTAPTVNVTAPAGQIPTATPFINYSASDANGVSSETCAMDGGTPSGCVDGAMWGTPLSDAAHTVVVAATDAAGNVGSGSSVFTVDTTPPDTIIDSGPSGYTPFVSPTFTFHGDPAGDTAGLECSLDGAAYTSCTSPKQYAGLSQGAHTFSVRSFDAVGNTDASPATRTFTVDSVQPSVSVTAPQGLQSTAAPQAVFSVSDANPVTNTCKVDNITIGTCTSGMNLPAQTEGNHTFSVTSLDGAGNSRTENSSFVVDTSAPDVSISGTTLTIATTPGTNNGLNVVKSGSTYTVSEATAYSIKAGAGCSNVTAVQVTCNDTGVTAVSTDLGDGNDNYSAGSVTVPTTIMGGPGNDGLNGGAGNDTIVGGSGGDYMTGGGGTDTLSYADHADPVTASLDGNTDNGSPGEGDSTQPDVENIIGGTGNDLLRSSTGNNSLNGGAGSDTVTFAGISVGVNANLATGVASGHGSDTFTSIENLTGGNGADTLTGDTNANVLDGGAGAANDTINGGTGVNTVSYASATAGVTVNITSSPGTSSGGAGTDSLTLMQNVTGSAFDDTITGSTAANVLNGSGGTDMLSYSAITSAINVNLGTGVVSGGGGADTVSNFENVNGGSAADTLTGDTNNNRFIGGTGTTVDTISGGIGTDTVDYSANTTAVTVNLSTGAVSGGAGSDVLSSIEGAIGGTAGDTITASSFDNVINTSGGTDTVTYAGTTGGVTVDLSNTGAQATGGSGSDTITNAENLTGGTGNDTLLGTSGNNVLNGGTGTNTVSFANTSSAITATVNGTATGAGTDTMSNAINIAGGNGNDTLTGTTAANVINGGGGTDTVSYSAITSAVTVNLNTGVASGGGGADTLQNLENVTTGSGGDTLTGTTGNNAFVAGSGTDTVVYSDATTPVTASLTSNTSSGGGGSDTFSSVERLTGGSGDDMLTGNTSANTINGAGGIDTVSYSTITSAVTVNLTTGAASGGGGSDVLQNLENVIGGTAGDNITGSAVDNVITGGTGTDTITAGDGNDTLYIRNSDNDSSNCGNGNDAVTADNTPNDTTVTLCETVTRG